MDTLDLPDRKKCFTPRALGKRCVGDNANSDFAQRASFCYVELMTTLGWSSFQQAVAPVTQTDIERRKAYNKTSLSWRRKEARTQVRDVASKVMKEWERDEELAFETVRDILGSSSGSKDDWSRLSRLVLDQERMDEMASSLGVGGQRAHNDREKAEMASTLPKARGEAELRASFRALQEKAKRDSTATAVAKALSKHKGLASLNSRALLRIVDQQSRGKRERGRVRSGRLVQSRADSDGRRRRKPEGRRERGLRLRSRKVGG